MPWFFIVTKLLMLKILLASISGLNGYEFGYHPSAEEFDSLKRDTSKTWTGDLLANERRRSWTSVPSSSSRNFFVPKFNYENEHNRYATTTHNSWSAGYQPHHNDNENDLESAANVLTGTNIIGSSLDFNMFSDEVSTVPVASGAYEVQKRPPASEVFPNIVKKPQRPVHNSEHYTKVPPTKPSTLNAAVEMVHTTPSESNKGSLSHLHKNSSEAHFPIFFTNPATGIVYAITEVGTVQDNSTQSNDSIPIYVTKEQYDRDIFLLKKNFEQNCRLPPNKDKNVKNAIPATSAISAPSNVTVRPQIIRLQKPLNNISKLPVAKLPTIVHRPPPVMVQTGVTVSDQINLPIRPNLPPKRRKKMKSKRKKKKSKRPGRKPSAVSSTRKPLIESTSKTSLPHIVFGHRTAPRPSVSPDKLSTQLEKPSLHTTIFSNRPIVATSGYMSNNHMSPMSRRPLKDVYNPHQNHRINRRSVTNMPQNIESFNDKNSFREDLQTSGGTYAQLAQGPTEKGNITKTLEKLPNKGKKSSKLSQQKGKRTTILATSTPKADSPESLFNTSTIQSPLAAEFLDETTAKSLNHETTQRSTQATQRRSEKVRQDNNKSKTKTKPKKKMKHKNENSESDYDLFDLDDDYEEDDSYYYDQEHRPAKPKKYKPPNNEYQNYFKNYSIDDLKESVTPDNSSSAEEEADFGALEQEVEYTNQDTSDENTSSNTKNTSGKKRIRRRPAGDISAASSTSYEDYDDDDDEDSDSGIGGFFRMIFYPVQMAMSRLFDSFAGEKDGASTKPKFPTYTQYNNAVRQEESSSEDDEQGNSLGGWFSSWFGFNRRTKKIGSTTIAPPPPLPLQQSASEEKGWLASWFGYGTTTEASYEDYDDEYDKWFSGWFDARPKARRRATTTTTAPLPQVPILTIVDPMRNPQNWIGILANHIINSTSATTRNPLIEAITRATSTTTENPDIPRKVSYDKYQIWRLKPQDDGQVRALEEYKRSEDGVKLHWLKGPSLRGLTDVLVPPKMLIDFQGTLNFESIDHEVLIFDVGKAIAYEKSKEEYYLTTTQRPNQRNQKNPQLGWHKYYEYDDIVKYLESIRIRHSQLIELIHIGRSYEGRPLVIVKIQSIQTTSAAAQQSRKKLKSKRKSGQANAVFIESGTHGMEWIGPATTTWMISELLRIMKSNKTNLETEFIKNTTWYIMPVLNPDGYVYSHEYDRFWKKSRSRHISRPSSLITSAMTWLQAKKATEKVCYGVDLDRNWHYQWGRRGSSKSPCNEFFAGPVPFSEPETKALSEFLMDYRKQIKLFFSLQSYGQVISYPIKANASFNSERMDDFLDVAMVGTDGLRKKGSKSRYKIDSTSDLMENRSGCSDAFAAYEVDIPFSYTMQLADNGVHGYLLPSSSIEPTARDAFEIITGMLDYI